jgi:hypothetical protein
MKRLIWQWLFVAVYVPYVTFLMWQIWGKPEFWPLVGVSLVLSSLAVKAGRNRREELQARLPGARTLGH